MRDPLIDFPMMILQACEPPVPKGSVMGLRVIKSRECKPGQALVANRNGNVYNLDFGPPLGCVEVTEEQEVGYGRQRIFSVFQNPDPCVQ